MIISTISRWWYDLEVDEKWPNYQDMAGRYLMSHKYHLVLYFWWRLVHLKNKVTGPFDTEYKIWSYDSKSSSCTNSHDEEELATPPHLWLPVHHHTVKRHGCHLRQKTKILDKLRCTCNVNGYNILQIDGSCILGDKWLHRRVSKS